MGSITQSIQLFCDNPLGVARLHSNSSFDAVFDSRFLLNAMQQSAFERSGEDFNILRIGIERR